jgi:hypothetical protein
MHLASRQARHFEQVSGETAQDFQFAAANTNYTSHCAIIVETGQDSAGG